MKQKAILISALLGMTVFFLSANAQQLVTKTFATKEGKVTVYLPSLSSGVTISGTVRAEPSGNNEKAKSRNSEILKMYRLLLGQKTIAVADETFSMQVPATGTSMAADLKNNRNETIASHEIPVSSFIMPAGFTSPSYFTSGEPFRITGPFDGDLTNTRVTVNGARTTILAEGAGQLYCTAPSDLKGNVEVQCTENRKSYSAKSNALQLDMTADKLSLMKGESTTLHIKVSGLEGLKEQVALTLQNLSGSTITMQGGSTQQLVIDPAACGPSGVYSTTRNIQSIRTGQFSVSATIEPPSDQNTTGTAALLCNCFINEQSHLLPQQQCVALGGLCAGSLAEAGGTVEIPDPPAAVNPAPATRFLTPTYKDPKTDAANVILTSPADDIIAVNFSSRPAGQELWIPAGTAIQNGNNWEINWIPPVGNDGGYLLRARFADKSNNSFEKTVLIPAVSTPFAASPKPGERISLSVSDAQLKAAEQKVTQTNGELNTEKQRLFELEKKYQEQLQQSQEKKKQAEELATIDKTLDKIPDVYRDSLKKLIDSLEKLRGGLPPQPDPAALKKNADDADQRLKDCLDRLEKLKKEKADLEKQRDDLKKQQDDLLKQMHDIFMANGWIGNYGYHPDGRCYWGYAGQGGSQAPGASEIGNKLRGMRKPYTNVLKRLKDLDNEIKKAEEDCDKLKKAADAAKQAEQNNNAAQALAGQAGELNRQIQSLLDLLRRWCAAHPGLCKFDGELSALNVQGIPSAAALKDMLSKMDDVIAKKQQLEKDLEKGAAEDVANAQNTAGEIEKQKEKVGGLEDQQKAQQAEADRLRQEREKQLEAERAKQRKKEEEAKAAASTPKPQPKLPQPVNPSDDQVKFQAQRLFRELYQQYLIDKGPCHCITKAIALANNTNTIVSDIIGNIGVGVAFAPLEALPGLSFGAKLGLGAAKALGSAIFGGQSFSDELAKNLFNVIGGEIFPKLTGDEFTGGKLNELASGGFNKLLEAEGVRSISWEGETELRGCGKVKGKTVTLINPNTGWVTIMIKIDNCPLVVIKYKVNKDGVPIGKPIVQTVSG